MNAAACGAGWKTVIGQLLTEFMRHIPSSSRVFSVELAAIIGIQNAEKPGVPCLDCGKEIGEFQILRDDEFCSSAHRKSYASRLTKALGWLSVPEPKPHSAADFTSIYPTKEGTR